MLYLIYIYIGIEWLNCICMCHVTWKHGDMATIWIASFGKVNNLASTHFRFLALSYDEWEPSITLRMMGHAPTLREECSNFYSGSRINHQNTHSVKIVLVLRIFKTSCKWCTPSNEQLLKYHETGCQGYSKSRCVSNLSYSQHIDPDQKTTTSILSHHLGQMSFWFNIWFSQIDTGSSNFGTCSGSDKCHPLYITNCYLVKRQVSC